MAKYRRHGIGCDRTCSATVERTYSEERCPPDHLDVWAVAQRLGWTYDPNRKEFLCPDHASPPG